MSKPKTDTPCTLSEVIKNLQSCMEAYGDIPFVVTTHEGEAPNADIRSFGGPWFYNFQKIEGQNELSMQTFPY